MFSRQSQASWNPPIHIEIITEIEINKLINYVLYITVLITCSFASWRVALELTLGSWILKL